jgi:ribonuclease HII
LTEEISRLHLCMKAIKGDEKIQEIMAASILAKVSRDRYMCEMDKIYPGYNFKKHKGYPTKEHYDLIKKYGSCDIHRKTFRGAVSGR